MQQYSEYGQVEARCRQDGDWNCELDRRDVCLLQVPDAREHAHVGIGVLVIQCSSTVRVNESRDSVSRTEIRSASWTAAVCVCSEYSSRESMCALGSVCSRSSAAAQ